MSISVWDGKKAQELVDIENSRNFILNDIYRQLGGVQDLTSWKVIQSYIRAGVIKYNVLPGEQLNVDIDEVLTSSISGGGVTDVTIDKDTFLNNVDTQKSNYEFSYYDSNWHYENEIVTLVNFGISVTGTPTNSTKIYILRSATNQPFNVLGIDEDKPSLGSLNHCLTIQSDKIINLGCFDPPQYLFGVSAEVCENFGWESRGENAGMPAGTYYITLDHGCYAGTTAEDCVVRFTTTKRIPIGGGIRHSTIGGAQSNIANYKKSRVLAGKFITYDSDTLTILEDNLETTEGAAGTYLGTTTARNPEYKVGDYINFTDRHTYGTNRIRDSYILQWLNSDEAVFQWKRVNGNPFTRNLNQPVEGFLHRLDPELKKILVQVRKRVARSISDGYGYDDIVAYCFPASVTDVYGIVNNSIHEVSIDGSGDPVRTSAYSYWKDNNTDSTRIKYVSSTGSANQWWLSSCYPNFGDRARVVKSDGQLNYYNGAFNSGGIVPCLYIG